MAKEMNSFSAALYRQSISRLVLALPLSEQSEDWAQS